MLLKYRACRRGIAVSGGKTMMDSTPSSRIFDTSPPMSTPKT